MAVASYAQLGITHGSPRRLRPPSPPTATFGHDRVHRHLGRGHAKQGAMFAPPAVRLWLRPAIGRPGVPIFGVCGKGGRPLSRAVCPFRCAPVDPSPTGGPEIPPGRVRGCPRVSLVGVSPRSELYPLRLFSHEHNPGLPRFLVSVRAKGLRASARFRRNHDLHMLNWAKTHRPLCSTEHNGRARNSQPSSHPRRAAD